MNGFRLADVQEYAHWLVKLLDSGKMPTHYYDYPFERKGMVVPLEPFQVNGECGARAKAFLVHQPSYYLGGSVGHNKVFLFNEDRTVTAPPWVPVYSNPEFQGLNAEVDRSIQAERRRSTDEKMEMEMLSRGFRGYRR